jgi:hypothetical protein
MAFNNNNSNPEGYPPYERNLEDDDHAQGKVQNDSSSAIP